MPTELRCTLNELLSKTWQSLAWRGAVALVFGILAAFWPGIALLWLVIFAAYALIGGTVSAVATFQNRKTNSNWWLMLLMGPAVDCGMRDGHQPCGTYGSDACADHWCYRSAERYC